jgi:hypothetical protein
MQTSLGKSTGCPAATPLTAPASVGFWPLRLETRSPGRSGLLRGSLTFGAAVCLGLLLHTASRRQGRRLTTASPCVQLPPARGCDQPAPRRTFTSNPVPMPGTPPQRQSMERIGGEPFNRDRNAVQTKPATSTLPLTTSIWPPVGLLGDAAQGAKWRSSECHDAQKHREHQ